MKTGQKELVYAAKSVVSSIIMFDDWLYGFQHSKQATRSFTYTYGDIIKINPMTLLKKGLSLSATTGKIFVKLFSLKTNLLYEPK